MGIKTLGENRFRLQIRRKGFPHFDKVFYSHVQAQAKEAEILGQQKSLSKSTTLTLSDAWTKYSQSYDFEKKPENTRKTEMGRIKNVLITLGAYSLTNLEDAPHLVMDYIDQRTKVISSKTKQKLSSTSIRLEIAALSSVAAWAVSRKYIRSNFARHVGRPGQSKRKRRVAPVEQAKLVNATLTFDDPKLAEAGRFALLLRHLGCRPGELATLRRLDVNLRRKEVTYRATKYKNLDRLVHTTKSTSGLLDAQFHYALEYAPDSEFVFSTKSRKKADDGGPVWVPYGYSAAIKRLRASGAVDQDFHAHAMRREFISRAIESGLPYSTIRKQTGHHSTQAIEIYDEGLSTAPEIREALDKHEVSVEFEQLLGMFENMGLSEQALEEIQSRLKGEKRPFFQLAYATDKLQTIGAAMPPRSPSKKRKSDKQG